MGTMLFGLNIDTLSSNSALDRALELLVEQKVSQVVTINPEMIEYANKNSYFKDIINESELVIPDGIGVKIALKINGINTDRIPGIDFARKLLEESAQKNIPVAIIGAKDEILTKAITNLSSEIENLNIVYSHDGYFSNDEEIYADLLAKSPKLVLVAMGSPRQEEFIYNAKKVLKTGLMIGIGGSLDVWSGCVKRAPKFFQKLGLEWFYRTVSQPSRLKRIFPTLPVFILKSIKYRIFK